VQASLSSPPGQPIKAARAGTMLTRPQLEARHCIVKVLKSRAPELSAKRPEPNWGAQSFDLHMGMGQTDYNAPRLPRIAGPARSCT